MVGKKNIKKAGKTLSVLEDVINHAYDNGDISNDLYKELVKVGVPDRRVILEVEETQKVQEVATTTSPNEHFGAAPLRDHEIVEKAPCEEPMLLTAPTEDCEPEYAPQIAECAQTIKSGVEEPLEDSHISGEFHEAPSTPLNGEYKACLEKEESERRHVPGKRSNVFSWCTMCRRLGWVMSDERNLLEDVSPGTEHREAIVVFGCKTCTAENDAKTCRRSAFAFSELERSPELEAIDVDPEAWQGTEAWKIACVLLERNVPVLGDGKGRTLMKQHTIWSKSVSGDRLVSVDVERYRRGERTNLVLPYLKGGFF